MPFGRMTRSPQVWSAAARSCSSATSPSVVNTGTPPSEVTALAMPGPATTAISAPPISRRMRRQCGDPELTQLPQRQCGFDRRTRIGEVDMHLRDGLITHDHNAMAEL